MYLHRILTAFIVVIAYFLGLCKTAKADQGLSIFSENNRHVMNSSEFSGSSEWSTHWPGNGVQHHVYQFRVARRGLDWDLLKKIHLKGASDVGSDILVPFDSGGFLREVFFHDQNRLVFYEFVPSTAPKWITLTQSSETSASQASRRSIGIEIGAFLWGYVPDFLDEGLSAFCSRAPDDAAIETDGSKVYKWIDEKRIVTIWLDKSDGRKCLSYRVDRLNSKSVIEENVIVNFTDWVESNGRLYPVGGKLRQQLSRSDTAVVIQGVVSLSYSSLGAVVPETLTAFAPFTLSDVPEGTPVSVVESRTSGLRFVWKNGDVRPVNISPEVITAIDKSVVAVKPTSGESNTGSSSLQWAYIAGAVALGGLGVFVAWRIIRAKAT